MGLITGKRIHRRRFLRGIGAAIGLPFLDAMVPAGRAWSAGSAPEADPTRLIAIEMVHGSAGSTKWGATQHMWSPKTVGRNFDLSTTALQSLESFRDQLTIISDTDVWPAEAIIPKEIGGDHFRSSATYLTQSHPKQTEGSDVLAGTSMDQMYASRFGQNTPIPSMQLCIENVDQAGGCAYGYSCVYTDTISWSSPTEPLPMIRDPRVAFDLIFGDGGTPAERAARRLTKQSILDFVTEEVVKLNLELDSADRLRMDQYLSNIREIERRIQRVLDRNTSGEMRELPEAPPGVPDSFDEHVQLMFDIQTVAFESDMTRVFSFKMGRDASGRVFPASGVNTAFHPASHHGDREKNIQDFFQINRYHVGQLPYLLKKLSGIREGNKNLLDKTMLVYGSPMGDPNVHNHKRCPLFIVGGANGSLEGELHLRANPGTPMANVMLTLLQKLGLKEVIRFGDSTGPMSLSL